MDSKIQELTTKIYEEGVAKGEQSRQNRNFLHGLVPVVLRQGGRYGADSNMIE